MKKTSIKWKIFLYLVGFCGILLVLLWLFQVVFLDEFYKAIKIKEIKRSAHTIEKNIESSSLGELVIQISESNDVCIEILSENGIEIYASDILRDCMLHKMPPFEKINLITKTRDSGGELLEYFSRENFIEDRGSGDKFIGRIPFQDFGIQESIIFSKIITNKEGEKVIILLNSVISPVNSTVKTIRLELYVITGFMLIFSIILAIVIAKRVSKPIEALNESAKILAKGKYDTIFSANGYKEIVELSDTLNFTANELSKVDTLRQELIANISHDLRTPLTLISGYAEAMRDLPNENNAENAQIIIDETKRLTTLVNDVLDISKLQVGMERINPQDYHFTNSIKSIVNSMNELIRKDGYVVKFFYEEEVTVTADEPKISQAFYNLLINAVNYTGKDKTIIIKQIVINGGVRIEVIDSGEGILEENIPYIWDRYYKGDKSHKRGITGTGLGLSIVKAIIEMHGGEYGVLPKINEGSVFWFHIT